MPNPTGRRHAFARCRDHGAVAPIDYQVGAIAANRSICPLASAFLPRPHDGRVSVANTKLDGMTDHNVVRTSHPWLVRNDKAILQTISFLGEGRFEVGS